MVKWYPKSQILYWIPGLVGKPPAESWGSVSGGTPQTSRAAEVGQERWSRIRSRRRGPSNHSMAMNLQFLIPRPPLQPELTVCLLCPSSCESPYGRMTSWPHPQGSVQWGRQTRRRGVSTHRHKFSDSKRRIQWEKIPRGLVLTLMNYLFVVQIVFIFLSVLRDLRHLILLFCTKCSNEAVFAADFHPTDTNIIVTCGKSHLYFWTLEGSSLIKKQGLFEVK